MRAPGTYHVRSSGRPVARDMLDLTGDIGGTIALFGLAGLRRGMGAIVPGCNDTFWNQLISWAKPSCWSAAATATENAIVYSGFPSPPAPNPPTGPTTIEEETIPGAFTPDQAIAGGVTATQQAMTNFYTGIAAANPPDAGQQSGGLSLLGISAVVLVGIAALSFLGTRRSR